MSETGTLEPEGEEASDTVGCLAEAVAGIADIVPRAPEGLLAPRLPTPFFAACFALAVAAHVGGLVAYVGWRLDEGFGGKFAEGTSTTAIEADIVDGDDAVLKGGRTEESSPGTSGPSGRSAIDQAASVSQQDTQASEMAETSPPTAASTAPPVLTADTQDASEAMAAIPPPPFAVDTTAAPTVETAPVPRVEEPEKPAQASEASAQTLPEAAPEQQASQASQGGEDGQARALVETPGNSGVPAPTPGAIKSYHERLGSYIRAHRPISRGRMGEVIVLFGLDSDGVLQFARVVKSTGNAQLEERSLAAIRKASPYPKPVPGMRGRQLEFTVPLTFSR